MPCMETWSELKVYWRHEMTEALGKTAIDDE